MQTYIQCKYDYKINNKNNYNNKIFFYCYTVHVVELLNYYTNHCTYIKFVKFTH